MRKSVVVAVIVLFLVMAALAEVVVLQEGKITTREPGSSVTVSGKTTSRVLYDGVLVTVPQGQKVSVSKKDDKILVSGKNLKNIEVAGQNISSKGEATIAVSPDTMKVSVIEGDTTIVQNDVIIEPVSRTVKNENKPNAQQVPVAPTKVTNGETVVFPEVSDYVNEIAAQQTVHDITDMSQYSPSGI